jgi:hypothetical protein
MASVVARACMGLKRNLCDFYRIPRALKHNTKINFIMDISSS